MPQHRVGIPDLLEVRPLAWSFLKGQLADRYSINVYPFERIPALLRAGDLELGFVSAVDMMRAPDLKRVRDLGVALLPGARNLALSLRCPIAEVRAVDCSAAPRWAVELARAALGRAMAGAVWRDRLAGAALDGENDAELLCGAAAHRAPDALPVAALWHERTAAPLPLGGWAASPQVDAESCEFALKSSLRYGLSSLEAVASEAAAESGLGRGELETHYRRDLSFVLDDAYRRGLETLARALERRPRAEPATTRKPTTAVGAGATFASRRRARP